MGDIELVELLRQLFLWLGIFFLGVGAGLAWDLWEAARRKKCS